MPKAAKAEDLFDPPEEYDTEIPNGLELDIAFEKALKLRRAKRLPPKPDVIVASTGTSATYRMGVPVMMEPLSQAAILNNLLCREELDPSGPLPPPSPTIIGLQKVSDAIANGEDITPYKENIERVLANQPEKGELLRSYINQADKEALTDMTIMRQRSLAVIKQASLRSDLHLSEALVVWRTCNEQIPLLSKKDADKPVDGANVVEKIDYHKQQVEREVQKRWEGTTPQGRELIRKRVWEAQREIEIASGVYPPGMEPAPPPEPPEDLAEPEPEAAPPEITLAHPL